ncbi:MAG TPA: ATP-binding protein [Mycobacteriales bacterium]|nr:ATP-binding protein [Mycobacteriales bacterium]
MSITVEEVRELFLFAELDEDKLAWLAEHGREEHFAAGSTIYDEADRAHCFIVLLDGTITLTRRVRGGGEVEVSRTSHRGAYFGAVIGLLQEVEDQTYTNSGHAITDCRLLTFPVAEFSGAVREWFPIASHLLSGLWTTMRTSNARVAERERLQALGAVTAGLTHELNNPAAAATRAAAELRTNVGAMRQFLGELTGWPDLTRLQDLTVKRAAEGEDLSPLQISDHEDELADWLDEHGVPDAEDLAADLAAAGLDTGWADEVAGAVQPEALPKMVRWLNNAVAIEGLLGEINDATTRIGNLLSATRQYSQMDRAPYQSVDIHELISSTLLMFKHKLGDDVKIVKEYDRSIPKLEVYAAELNQVWTNLIHNALDAMGGSGTLTIRTHGKADQVVVEICDTGPGIPEDVRGRIFDPFFTTKQHDGGTGLGLDISRRIVVDRHGGDLRVSSVPGDTRFQVWLPIPQD